MSFYHHLVRRALFACDPEATHHRALYLASTFRRVTPLWNLVGSLCRVDDPRLAVSLFGRTFKNPIGLAAGFDKGAEAFPFFASLGFGHVEIGTVTTDLQPGNNTPRIWRIPAQDALVNRLGFPSAGVANVIPRLGEIKKSKRDVILGVNIGKSKSTALEDAAKEYQSLFRQVRHAADYVAINVSSPNTPELRKLQEPARLRELFAMVREESDGSVPLLIKVAPDLSNEDLESLLTVVVDEGVSGIIATNTTIDRSTCPEARDLQGGLSGRPLHAKSCEMVRQISKFTEGTVPIIGVGGIFSLQEVLQFFAAGASLVQLYTGLVYEGPFLIKKICQELVALMEREGIESVQELKKHPALLIKTKTNL